MKRHPPAGIFSRLCLLLVIGLAAGGCGDGGYDATTMNHQPRRKPLDASGFFADDASARPREAGTIAREGRQDDVYRQQGTVTLDLLRRGQERFNINCAVCHGLDGYGDGVVVERGYPRPPSFHDDRLRGIGDEHIFNVITHGLGKMQPYADQVAPVDRYAIIAYIRALQRSQHATPADVPPEARAGLDAKGNSP